MREGRRRRFAALGRHIDSNRVCGEGLGLSLALGTAGIGAQSRPVARS